MLGTASCSDLYEGAEASCSLARRGVAPINMSTFVGSVDRASSVRELCFGFNKPGSAANSLGGGRVGARVGSKA